MKTVKIINCHAGGEIGDVVTDGLSIPEAVSIRALSLLLSERYHGFLMNEPNGGVFRHKNILVPPNDPAADFAFVIFEPDDTPPMSGSNIICVATAILQMGLHPIEEPITRLKLEVPAGVIDVEVDCIEGIPRRVSFVNVPSFVCKTDFELEVEGVGKLVVDTAYGGDSFVIVDATQLGFSIQPHEAKEIATIGARIIDAANEQIGFSHPELPWLQHFAFCKMTLPIRIHDGKKTGRQCVTIQPGKIDRSPTGTGCSARMAIMHAKGELEIGETFVGESIIDSTFECKLIGETQVGETIAVIPQVSGTGFVTGTQELWIRNDDPFPNGYRVGDTWPLKED